MSFANETPLDDVLKYIKQATTTPTFAGIPIYVDPIGLQEAEKSITAPVSLDLDGVPLRRTLQLLLDQLGLVYFVDDGILVITSSDRGEQSALPPSMAEPSPLVKKQEQAERGELTTDEMKELIEVLKLVRQVRHHAAKSEEAGGGSGDDNEEKPKTEQMGQLLKEVRELIELLKAERQGTKAPEKKTGNLQ
jgi:hypothetical protein